ncbi:sugar porter family MFS transporter [uncultured Paludibaculum sp.]|uniref:sugar porter family MFS transporter n=1 Tax=uncultured Paludibaculum sp. TaxID=1765020 RepID=UPI002AAB67B8|nr:sugar porter family MFS transporter [uncultured Paludibaculum sp.]
MPGPMIRPVSTPVISVSVNRVYVYLASMVAATSGLLFGFDIAVINGALLFLRQQFALTELQTEFAASSLLAGCVVGAALGGGWSDRLGRKKVLIFCAALFALSSVGAALPRNLTEFVFARVAGGVAIGMASLLAPLYIAEVAPAHMRGRLVSLNQMAIVTGILLAYVVNWTLSWMGPEAWRWMFAVAAIPSLFFLVALFFVPESPRWLCEKGRDSEAHAVLAKVSGQAQADVELAAIREVIQEESGTLSELLAPGYRRALILAVALAILQQWTGVNTVLFYGSVILKEQVGGHSQSAAIGANVFIGLVNCLSTIVALWLIDKLGRRPLLMFSAGGMVIAHAGLALAFLRTPPNATIVMALMILCTASFAVGLGPGVWVVLSEIFPTRIRGRAMSIATVALWVACVVLTFTYLSIASALGPTGAFLIYGCMCLLTIWVVAKFTPETKGHTLEEIERLWRP